MFESVTAVSVTLSWMSGLNGGSVQTFTVYYRKDGDSKISYRQGIEDNGENIQHKISGLDPSTKYFFQVQSRNENGISNSQSEIEISTIGNVCLLCAKVKPFFMVISVCICCLVNDCILMALQRGSQF